MFFSCFYEDWYQTEHVCFLDSSLGPNSKLLLASAAQVLSLVLEEKAALQAQLLQEDDAQECFIQRALCLLLVKKKKITHVVTRWYSGRCSVLTVKKVTGLIPNRLFFPRLSLCCRSERKCCCNSRKLPCQTLSLCPP